MKLKTKLLPLAGIAVTTAAVTPFIASCNSNKGYTGTWNWNPNDGFKLSTTPRDPEEIVADDEDWKINNKLVDLYANDIKNDYNVFYDDFASNSINPNAKYGDDYSYFDDYVYYNNFLPSEISIQITNVDTLTYKPNPSDQNIKLEAMLLSFDVDMTGWVFSIDVIDYDYYDVVFEYTKCHMNLVNIPYQWIGDEPIGFEIQAVPFQFYETWSGKVDIEQSGITRETLVNPETIRDIQYIDFPILSPGGEGKEPIQYLDGLFSTRQSYHFAFSDIVDPE